MINKSFNERCYSALKKVPKGKVTTYKAIAQALNTKAYRAVGNAMNKNPHGYVILGRAREYPSAKEQKSLVPCHRVVGSDGSMTGFASGIKNKENLLKKEGVKVINGNVDLKKYLHKF